MKQLIQSPPQNEDKSIPETTINTKTKELIEQRILDVVAQIMSSEESIKEFELYKVKCIIKKETLKDILKEIIELHSPDGDDGRVQPGQKSHAEIIHVLQSSDSSASGDISVQVRQDNPKPKEYFLRVPPGDDVPVHTDPEVLRKILHPVPATHLPAEIIPFKEVPAFTYNKLQLFKQIGKIKVFLSGENIAIYHPAYSVNIFTSMDEIRRMKALSEMEIKLTLQEYEKRTYRIKAVVLRHFLRELKSIDELKLTPIPAPIRTYSKLSELDDIKKANP